jgi:hypothetical protein
MLISTLVPQCQYASDQLAGLQSQDVVGIINLAIMLLSAKTGIKFSITGATWDLYDLTIAINNPQSLVIDNNLLVLIILQTKQVVNSSSNVIRTKFGSVLIDYDPKAWQRDEDMLDNLIQSYAVTNNVNIPTGFYAMSLNEYDLTLNPNFMLNILDGTMFGYLINQDFWI